MKRIQLLLTIATLPLVGACTTTPSYKLDPRSSATARDSLYLNTDASSGSTGGGSGTRGGTRVTVSEPQAVPIRVKPDTQPVQYQNTTAPSNASAGTTDRATSASPLRHDAPDKPLYQR
jgi:hypothetical protein